jgi:hypothetical protein
VGRRRFEFGAIRGAAMSRGFDQRTGVERAPSPARSTVEVPARSTLTAAALPRTTRDLPTAELGPFIPVRITTDLLNVRRTPQLAAGNVIGGLHRGAVVMPLAREGEWLRIAYDGTAAFIHGDYVEQAQPTAAAAPGLSAEAAPALGSENQSASTPPQAARQPPSSDATTHQPQPGLAQSRAPNSEPIPGTPEVSTEVVWTPPADAQLEDAELLELAAKIHAPTLDQLTRDVAGVLVLNKTLRATRSLETRFEVTATNRAMLVAGIRAVRTGLAALANPSDPNIAAFIVAVNHRLEETAPYHFQLNIPTIESRGGWSTCNLTSLAMALETLGKGASAYPASEHPKLLAVARQFRADIAQARLAANGTAPDLSSLMGLRLPDFLQLAAVVEFITSETPSPEEIVAAATRAVDAKLQSRFLKQLARKFGADAKDKAIRWDTTNTPIQNRTITNALESYGGQHRGDGSHGVEQLNTARNLLEKETDPRKRAVAERRYQGLLPGQAAALEGQDIERDLSLETYKSAVVRELGPELDAGNGVHRGSVPTLDPPLRYRRQSHPGAGSGRVEPNRDQHHLGRGASHGLLLDQHRALVMGARVVVVLALGACHSAPKPEGTAAGSNPATVAASAATQPSAASPTSMPPTGKQPAAPGAPTPVASTEAHPKRSSEDAVRMAEAEKALITAMANAKQAKTLKEACSGLDALEKGLLVTNHVTPPVGFEREFAESRNGLFMKLGVIQDQDCADGSGLDADTILSGLESLRTEFSKLQRIGAKP